VRRKPIEAGLPELNGSFSTSGGSHGHRAEAELKMATRWHLIILEPYCTSDEQLAH
jgi:hypothetical protein